MERKPHHKFPLGKVLVSREAARILDRADIEYALDRHASGDYAEWCGVDESEFSLSKGRRISNDFRSPEGKGFQVVTEPDRSVTTVMMNEDW